jgi:hypothetical protein
MPDHDLKKAKAFFQRERSGTFAINVLKRSTNPRIGSHPFSILVSRFSATNGNEPVDTMNLHPHFRGPTKETFIDT